MTLLDRLNNDLREAMRARDEHKLSALRMVRAAIKNAEVAKMGPLDEGGVVAVLSKEVKERKDSLAEYQKANRTDLVQKEELELAILSAYLPEQMSRGDIEAAVRAAIAQVGAKGPADKGRVMPVVIAQTRGKADGREVNEVVTEQLAALG